MTGGEDPDRPGPDQDRSAADEEWADEVAGDVRPGGRGSVAENLLAALLGEPRTDEDGDDGDGDDGDGDGGDDDDRDDDGDDGEDRDDDGEDHSALLGPEVAEAGGPSAFARAKQAILARTPEHDLVPSLERIAALLDLLGSPQQAYPVVHVTGTNGKTTTTRLIDAVLSELGLRTGRFTSPHLSSITERIAMHGQPLDAARFAAVYEEVAPFVDLVDSRNEIRMSFFEVLTAMAYAAFADAPVDAAVVEVGMGGTWDATNTADGRVAVITPIALDHVRFLGSTVAEVAAEKAGIIKPGALVVIAEQPREATEVLLSSAARVGARVVREGVEFGVLERRLAIGGQLLRLQGLAGVYEEVFLPLHGEHQAHNAACALAAVEGLLGSGSRQIDQGTVRAGFANATSPGRLEVLRTSPTVLVDAAHNPAGAAVTARAVREEFTFSRLVGVVAVFADKDVEGILTALEPVLDEVLVTEAASERAMPAEELGELAEGIFGAARVRVVPRLQAALHEAVRRADAIGLPGAGVLVTGSITTVAQARALLGRG